MLNDLPDNEQESGVRPRTWLRVGGVASAIILPAFFDRVFSPHAKLEYSVISSPAIDVGPQFTSIYSLHIVNTGSTKITGINAAFEIHGGQVSKATIGQSDGERPTITPIDAGARLHIQSMFPEEKLTAVLLVSANNPTVKPSINVRSDQVLGKSVDPSVSKDEDLPAWFALFPAVGAMLASILLMIQLRTKWAPPSTR